MDLSITTHQVIVWIIMGALAGCIVGMIFKRYFPKREFHCQGFLINLFKETRPQCIVDFERCSK